MLRDLCIEHTPDITNIIPISEIFVHKTVDITKLKFNGGSYVIKANNPAVLMHYIQSSLETSLMVIGHFQYEKVFEYITVHMFFYCARFVFAFSKMCCWL